MKAVVASLATAAVLAGAAWASNITPQQFAKLSGRVAKLERQNACLVRQWNAQKFEPYAFFTTGNWPTKSGNLTTFTQPSQSDGITASGYLVASDTLGSTC